MQAFVEYPVSIGNIPSLFLKDVFIPHAQVQIFCLMPLPGKRGSRRNLHLEEHSYSMEAEHGSRHCRDCKLWAFPRYKSVPTQQHEGE